MIFYKIVFLAPQSFIDGESVSGVKVQELQKAETLFLYEKKGNYEVVKTVINCRPWEFLVLTLKGMLEEAITIIRLVMLCHVCMLLSLHLHLQQSSRLILTRSMISGEILIVPQRTNNVRQISSCHQ